MKLISEFNDYAISPVIVEGKEDGKKDYFIEGIFMQSEIKNRNGRIYPKEVIQKEVKRYNKEFVEQDRAFGELGHPEEINDQFRQSVSHDYQVRRRW